MPLDQYIINDLKPFDLNTPIGELQEVFNQLTYSHVPIQKDGIYIGCLSETDVYCFDANEKVEDVLYAIEHFNVHQSTIWLDVLDTFALNDSNIMPVLDEENNYLGYYQLIDVISLFRNTPFFSEAGGIIVIEKAYNDYSFSEVCQIVESNNVKVLGVFVSRIKNDMAQITIKIENSGLSAIFETLRRYGYTIISGHEDDSFLKTLKDRSAYLDRYLNL
ncbi:MAG: acetoin utilization protein acuB [Bacteroidetes bacterium]|nr:acetoin utilization protein acuB [Bacteroidota bacterium]MDA0861017.1 acetoin utilization protein acuB [Bacteroidota bacterium]MDA1318266.1 acetoin utilization protein acuB [Bacteroidota bacterium]